MEGQYRKLGGEEKRKETGTGIISEHWKGGVERKNNLGIQNQY